jgi:flagellar hook-associated protein 2
MGTRVGSITFGGLSSGLKTDEIVSNLVELERRPLELLEKRRDAQQTRRDVFAQLNSKTLALRDALRRLDNLNLVGSAGSAAEEFSAFSATSSDTSVARASVRGAAAEGVLNVRVQQLAAATRLVSDQNHASLSDSVGTGTFRISVAGVDTDIEITNENDELEQFVQAINDSSADVTAFVLNDGSANPYRLVIQGNSSGAAKAVTITSFLSGGSPQSPSFSQTQAAQNAQIYLDPDGVGGGTLVQSATNTVSDFVKGVSLQLVGRHDPADLTDSLSVTIEADGDATAGKIREVVELYNGIVELVNEQAQLDPKTGRGGPLMGERTLADLQQRLGLALASESGSGTLTRASQIGLRLGARGTLALDEDQLRAQLAANPAGVRELFSGAGSLADKLREVADAFVDPVDGLLVARAQGAGSAIADLEEQIALGEERLERVEAALVRQFAALERILSGIQRQGGVISQFLALNQGGGRR